MGVNYKRTKRWYDRKPWSEIMDGAGRLLMCIIWAWVIWIALMAYLVLKAMV